MSVINVDGVLEEGRIHPSPETEARKGFLQGVLSTIQFSDMAIKEPGVGATHHRIPRQ